MLLYGILAGSTVVLTDDGSGYPIYDNEKPSVPEGYVAESRWVIAGGSISRVWDVVPIEGTPQDAALALSKLQFRSLPDDVAYEFRALADEWTVGETYHGPVAAMTLMANVEGESDPQTLYAGDRIRYKGVLYKVLQDHVSQADKTPDVTPELYSEVAFSQSSEDLVEKVTE